MLRMTDRNKVEDMTHTGIQQKVPLANFGILQGKTNVETLQILKENMRL